MFHRDRSEKIKPQGSHPQDQGAASLASRNKEQQDKSLYQAMDQTAVRSYTKPQDEGAVQNISANANTTKPYAVKKVSHSNQSQTQMTHITNEKEAQKMNNPEKQTTDNQNAQGAARVDIPGQNFQRPNAATPAGNRPAYPGASYPGAQGNATASPSNANDVDNSRKLVIGQGITMSGEIEACDHLIVQGTIEASLKGANILDVAESGSYFGTVEIEEANIAGRFEGDITVKGRLTIESTGTIIGSVTYKELSMEAGATLDGSVSPIGSENAVKKAKTSPKSKKVSQNNGAELPFANQAAE